MNNIFSILYYSISSTVFIPFIYFLYNPSWNNCWFLLFLIPLEPKKLFLTSYTFNVNTEKYSDESYGYFGYFIFILLSCYCIYAIEKTKYPSFISFYSMFLVLMYISGWYKYNIMLFFMGYKIYKLENNQRKIYLISKKYKEKKEIFKISKDIYIC